MSRLNHGNGAPVSDPACSLAPGTCRVGVRRNAHFLRMIVLLALVLCGPAAFGAGDTNDCTQAVLDQPGFPEGLVWIGTNAPSGDESCFLYNIVTNLSDPTWTSSVETFFEVYPDSPWAASLHHAYASFCRRTGRTTKALDHWQSAWTSAAGDTTDNGKLVGGAALAAWTDLLSSLGRVEEIGSLVPSGDQWPFANHQDLERFQGAKNSWLLMQMYPEIAFRCGTLALKSVGLALGATNGALEDLPEVPCPTNGFSLAALASLGQARGLDVIAAHRDEGSDLVIPCLIHWQQDHYAAIVDYQEDSGYLVVDPTFDNPKWMPAEVINQEASGAFLIVSAQLPGSGWSQLDSEAAEAIHGQGLPNNVKNGKDKGCDNPSAKRDCPCKDKKKGMPVWWVSEPYISLWLADEPLSYLTSRGEPFSFTTTFKQRDTRPTASNTWLPITGWNHNWSSFIRLVSTSPCISQPGCGYPVYGVSDATLFLPDGGEVSFPAGNRFDAESRLLLAPQSAISPKPGQDHGDNGLRVIHADGSQDIYGWGISYAVVAGDYPFADYILTRRIDPHGNVTRFYYEFTGTIGYRLKYVVDYDGRTNTLQYTANSLLSEVDNPYGQSAHFSYDGAKNLVSLIDAAGLTSTLDYDTNGYPARLITPYGTNQFAYTVNSNDTNNNFGGHNLIDRSVIVTEPGGATSLYLYRYDSPFMPTNYPASEVPTNTPLGTLDDGSGATNSLGSVSFRNSFFWAPRQYAALSTTVLTNLNSADYLRARMRHWLQDTNELFLSGYVSVERDPSLDGSADGLKVFYDYAGKIFRHRQGAYALPAVTAWRLPGGETHYEYFRFDNFGNITNAVQTYTKSDGTLGARTNQLFYAQNTYTNVLGTLSGGAVINAVTNTFTIPNLLSNVVTTDGSSVWQAASFNPVTWTNDYPNGTQTNRVLLFSKRVIPRYFTNSIGDVTQLSFSSFNKIRRINWPSGLTTTNLFNSGGFLSRTIDLEIARTNSFSYTSNGLIAAFTNELGLALYPAWDPLLRLSRLGFPDGSYLSNRYERLDIIGRRDRSGNWTTFGFDGLDQLIAATNANGAVTKLGWCGCGSLENITNALGQGDTLSHDSQSRLTDIQLADGSSVSYTYDLAGRVTKVQDGAGRFLTYAYNNQALVTTVSNAVARLESIVYDVRDRPIQITDAYGVTVTNTFDNLNRLTKRAWPAGGGSEGFLYSASGLVAYTNQNNKITRYARDAAGRVTAVTNANLEVVQFAYNPAGQITNLLDGLGHATRWKRNEFGWVTNKVDALDREIFRFAYNLNGWLTNRWTPEKGNTAYAFDPVGNITSIQYPASSIAYAYNALNQLTNMSDAVGTTKFTWTAGGQLASEDGPWSNDTISYGYNQRLRSGMSLDSAAWTYSYDSAWRLQTLTSLAGPFTYSYPSAAFTHHASRITYPNSAYVTNHLDTLARLDYTALANQWGHVLDGYSYTHDLLGLRTNIVRDFGLTVSTVTARYDDIGQLTGWSAREINGVLRLNEQLDWNYDSAHNLCWRTNGALTQTFVCDPANELTNITRSGTLTVSGATPGPATNVTINGHTAERYGDFTFARTNFVLVNGDNVFTNTANNGYGASVTNITISHLPTSISLAVDSNGNLTNDGTRSFFFDADDELTNVTVVGQWKTEFVYDGLERRRIAKDFAWQSGAWVKTNETRYVYDGMLPIAERDTNNISRVTYTRGPDLSASLHRAGGIGGLLARTDANGSSYYHSDGGGNVTALVDAAQNVTARYLYDPFGRLVDKSGPMADANTMGYSSMPRFDGAGLVGYPRRFYAPGFHRFLNADPIGIRGGLNLYSFVRNNPLRYVDPLGLQDAEPEVEPRGEITEEILESLEGNIRPSGRPQSAAERFAESARMNNVRDQMIREGKDPEMKYLEAAKEPAKPEPKPAPKPAVQKPPCVEKNAPPQVPPGVIYLRTDQKDEEYVGQAKSWKRYMKRISEHRDAHPDSQFDFDVLQRVDQMELNKAEEDWIRAGGGPQSTGGRLQNDRHQMSDSNYRAIGGVVPYP